MKNYLSLLASAALLLTSCYHAHDELSMVDETRVSFDLALEGLSQESMTRAERKMPVLTPPTKLLIIDDFGGDVSSMVKTSLDAITVPLKHGKHDLYFVATAANGAVFDKPTMTIAWPKDGKLKDVWTLHYQITVDESTTFEQLVLQLAMADVRVSTYDMIPTGVTTARIEAPDFCTGLDLKTMQGFVTEGTANPLSITYNVASYAGSNTFAANVYTFVPASGTVGDLTVGFYADAECTTERKSRVLSDIKVTCGYVSFYEGYFFGDGVTIPIRYTDAWLGANEYAY